MAMMSHIYNKSDPCKSIAFHPLPLSCSSCLPIPASPFHCICLTHFPHHTPASLVNLTSSLPPSLCPSQSPCLSISRSSVLSPSLLGSLPLPYLVFISLSASLPYSLRHPLTASLCLTVPLCLSVLMSLFLCRSLSLSLCLPSLSLPLFLSLFLFASVYFLHFVPAPCFYLSICLPPFSTSFPLFISLPSMILLSTFWLDAMAHELEKGLVCIVTGDCRQLHLCMYCVSGTRIPIHMWCMLNVIYTRRS